ncbi:hypothetical protein EDC01DRAFT_634148 [Geopyxis carbonaria]|nr:hypothetical protein EDC01DRAFT_634148 [Geopyxis carbonaria]
MDNTSCHQIRNLAYQPNFRSGARPAVLHRHGQDFPYVYESPTDFMIMPQPTNSSQNEFLSCATAAARTHAVTLTSRNIVSRNPRQAVYDTHNELVLSGVLNVDHHNRIGASTTSDDMSETLEDSVSDQACSALSLRDLMTGQYNFSECDTAKWTLNSYITQTQSTFNSISDLESRSDLNIFQTRKAVLPKEHNRFLEFFQKQKRFIKNLFNGRHGD